MGSGVSSSMALALAGFCFTPHLHRLRLHPRREGGPTPAASAQAARLWRRSWRTPEVAEGDASGEESGRRDGFRQWVRGHLYCTPLMAGDESFRRSASSSTSWARRSLPSRPPPRSRCRISPSMAPPLRPRRCSTSCSSTWRHRPTQGAGGRRRPAVPRGGLLRSLRAVDAAISERRGPAPRMPVAGGPRRSMLSLITCSIRRH